MLISGITRSERLGKVVYAAGENGFSTFALDVVEVLCEAIGQRLVDFNRERRHLAVPVTNGAELLAAIVRDLDGAQIALSDLALRRPTLDDVFFSLTGHAVSEAEPPEEVLLQRSKR